MDALLNNKEVAISEAKRAIELLPISKDAVDGPSIEINLAIVYAWTNELGLAFEELSSLTKVPNGIFYGQLKRDPYWEPIVHWAEAAWPCLGLSRASALNRCEMSLARLAEPIQLALCGSTKTILLFYLLAHP